MTEARLQAKFLTKARQRGWKAVKLNADGETGWPDVLIVHPAGVAFVEVKSPSKRGRLSLAQNRRIAELRALNAVVLMLDDPSRIDAILDQIGNDS